MSTPAEPMLYHCPPEVDFATNAVTGVPQLPQVFKVLRRIEAAGAVAIRDFGRVYDAHVASSGRNPAPGLNRPMGEPWLAVE